MGYHRLKKEAGDYVLAKYQYQCTQCGNTTNLCVHHIVKMLPEEANYNDIENLTVLCRSCHMSHHRKEGDVSPPSPPPGNPFGRRGKGNPPLVCKVDECNKMQHGRGLCKKHYARMFRKNQGW